MNYFRIIKSLTFILCRFALAEDSRGLLFCDNGDRVFYYLYTDKHPVAAQIIKSNNLTVVDYTDYNPGCTTSIVVHGWMSNALDMCTQVIKNGYLSSTEYDCQNIFVVDWSECASNMDYFGPAYFVENVGNRIGDLVEHLVEKLSTPIENIHVVGHSLGAHVAGFAGKSVQKRGMELYWVTGLDPAAPLFYPLPQGHRLSRTDGLCVETLQTTQGDGFPVAIGKVSYFVNGGVLQPGCKQGLNLLSIETCSHILACNYYAEAVRLNTKNKFFSEKCKSRNCCNTKADLDQKPGTNSTCKTLGIFAFNTNAYGVDNQEDYGLGPDGAVPCSGKECYQSAVFLPSPGKTCDNVDFFENVPDEDDITNC